MKTVAEKMGVKTSMRAIQVHEPASFLQTIGLTQLPVARRLTGRFDYVHFFAKDQADLRKNFSRLKKSLQPAGMLWVSWCKKGKCETDLSLPKVIEIGYDNGLVESKTLRIDETWSAMKFTFPVPGKIYKNSFGKLKLGEE